MPRAPYLLLQQQLPHKRKRTSQAPPRRGRRAQRPAEQQREVPVLLDAQQDGDARVQHRVFALRVGGVQVRGEGARVARW